MIARLWRWLRWLVAVEPLPPAVEVAPFGRRTRVWTVSDQAFVDWLGGEPEASGLPRPGDPHPGNDGMVCREVTGSEQAGSDGTRFTAVAHYGPPDDALTATR